MTDIPENPSEKRTTVASIGAMASGSANLTPMAIAMPMISDACRADMSEMAAILPTAIAGLDMGEARTLFMNPYRLSHSVLTPPNMLVNMAVSTMTPGVMNSMYSPSNPADSMSGCVPANMLPTTTIQTTGCMRRMSTPLRDLRYRFISRQNTAYASDAECMATGPRRAGAAAACRRRTCPSRPCWPARLPAIRRAGRGPCTI